MLVAVIDIGSNSVRLVLYQYVGNHAQPFFNEKLACALGASLIHSNRLDEAAKERVRATITRFRQIIDVYAPNYITAIATAAMRESEDGQEFAEELSELLGHEIRVISGRQEACYSAMGVRSTSWRPQGIVADLGGGSTDLARLTVGVAPEGLCSIPTGTLGLSDIYKDAGEDAVRAYMRGQLAQCSHDIKGDTLYAVGGSFRAIARHHMKRHDYPLRVIHDYTLERHEINALAQQMRDVSLNDDEYFIGVPRKRQSFVYPALLALQEMLESCEAQRVVFSSAGVREGALRAVRGDVQPYDPLLAMICAMPEAKAQTDYTKALQSWLLSSLPCNEEEKRLVVAFSHISELATTVHPEHRALMAFERLLATMSYGMTHTQQVLLAVALYYRYKRKYRDSGEVALLSTREHQLAYAIGQLADLAHNLSAGNAELLQSFQLVRMGDDITVKSCGAVAAMVPPNAENWCDGLGEIISAFSSLPR